MKKKQISKRDIVGQKGIALIEQIVLDMGFVWYPTGGLEAGIDGYIEIRDPQTGEVSNTIIQVQSKANYSGLTCETEESFVYDCDPKDLKYWLSGNAPVILIVSKPNDREAFWINLKEYFSKPENIGRQRVKFDKKINRFAANPDCINALIGSAVDKKVGLFLSPVPVKENIYTNLLKVNAFPSKIYVGDTYFRNPKEVYSYYKEREIEIPGEWFLKNKKIFSVHDLTEYPFSEITDLGTVDPFGGDEWASSEDSEQINDFTWLLNLCLKSKVSSSLREWKERSGTYLFVRPSPNLEPIVWTYQSLKQSVTRNVFSSYTKKSDPTQISYYRHSAFSGKFVRIENEWYLSINPTYHFTHDGYKQHRYSSDMLKKIKQLENNSAVLGQIVAWSYFLAGGESKDLFEIPYEFLSFGKLLSFNLEEGIDDKVWLSREDSDSMVLETDSDMSLPLFESHQT